MEKRIKKFLIEVEEGMTECGQCPDDFPCGGLSFLHCCDYNLATMKITEMEEENNDGRTIN